jgi:hypothetical protein
MPELHQSGGEELQALAVIRMRGLMIGEQRFNEHFAARGRLHASIDLRPRPGGEEFFGLKVVVHTRRETIRAAAWQTHPRVRKIRFD